ncbi:hypothetical protein TNCV_2313111 [Trichonephila clavipes]|nr:hypothetical protein TNCV_2313111 [Trichonephila clavipes]
MQTAVTKGIVGLGKGINAWRNFKVSEEHNRPDSEVTPRLELKVLWGVTVSVKSMNVLSDKYDFDCTADFVFISKPPDRIFLTDYGSPIPYKAFCIAKGDLLDISLLGKEKMKRCICSYLINRLIGYNKAFTQAQRFRIHRREKVFILACLHPPQVQQRRQCASQLATTRLGAYLEYTQDIALQHKDEDPTGKPDTPYLQHKPYYYPSEETFHQPTDRSKLTPASHLQRSLGQRECKRYPQDTFPLLTGDRTQQTCELGNQQC